MASMKSPQSEDDQTSSSQEVFSLSKANSMVPLLQLIVLEIKNLTDEVRQTESRLESVGRSYQLQGGDDIYQSEVVAVQESMGEMVQRLKSCHSEIQQLNICKDSPLDEGGVDFPGTIEGHKVTFCWKLGEQTVCHWHHPDEDCDKRKVIPSELVIEAKRKKMPNSNSESVSESLIA